MANGFIAHSKAEIARAGAASSSVLDQIEQELQREQTADLWILRGDAIQLSDGDAYDLDDAKQATRGLWSSIPTTPKRTNRWATSYSR